MACIVFGTCATFQPAEASERPARDVRKQDRAAVQPAPPRQAVKVVTPTHVSRQPAQNRQMAAAPAASRQAAAPTRQAALPPRAARQAPGAWAPAQQAPAASTGLVQPVAFVVPPAAAQDAALRGVGQGTPILPVAITSGLSCVPFARLATGMDISGNGRDWWHNAAGRYARGQQPERGSVLAFRASGGMVHGHVAVVSRVVNDRTVLIDHANWAGPGIRRGTVMRNVAVVDVSDRNDWTAVRVQVGHDATTFGRTYATFGFIYNRPAGPRVLTAEAPRASQLAEDVSPHALRHMRLATQAFAE